MAHKRFFAAMIMASSIPIAYLKNPSRLPFSKGDSGLRLKFNSQQRSLKEWKLSELLSSIAMQQYKNMQRSDLLAASPFEKGGLRGIYKMGF